MSARHDDFEVLCALAAIGNLTKTEHDALREHLKNCIACQSRLVEMRRLAVPLLFAQQLKTPGRQLRKGLQDRFAERAIREGIPLRHRPQGVGVNALGMVTVVLVVLLLVTATLEHSSITRSAVHAGVSKSAQRSAALQSPNSVASPPAPARARRMERRSSSAVSPIVKPELPVVELAALSGHQFTFTLASRNAGIRAYPLSTTIRLPEVVPPLTFAHRPAALSLDTTSEVFRHYAPHLLAESERGAPATVHFQSNLASQSLNLDNYRNALKANGFELIYNLVPGRTSQERSQ